MNAFVTANGVPVMNAEITRPRIGNWHADLTVDAAALDRFSGPVEIVIAEAFTLEGTILRKGVHHETVFLRVLGGRGGLGKELLPRAYSNVPLRVPLTDALREAGEMFSPTSDLGALETFLPKWVRLRQKAGSELGALVKASGAEAWRVLSDGSIWIGTEGWAPSSLGWQEIEFDPKLGVLTFASDVPTVDPGQTFTAAGETYDGRKVSMVKHVSSAEEIRHFAWLEDDETGDTDRQKAGLDAYIASRVQPQLDRSACYWATVVSQNADGTLELKVDSDKVPPLSGVPITPGVAAASMKVSAGARVLLQFADADATKPVVTGWGTNSATELDLTATAIVMNGGTHAVARVTDLVAADTTMATWVAAVHALLNGTGAASKGPLVAPTDFGKIASGASGVKA